MSKGSAKLGSTSKGIVINRTSSATHGPFSRMSMGGGNSTMSRMSMSGPVRMIPGSAGAVTSEHIQDVKDKSQKEKKAFQECNRLLAKRVETEKFLASQNKILLEEIKMLRGKKNLDRTPLEEQCLQEIEAYKERVTQADMDKAGTSARIANLEDQVHDINKLNETLETDIAGRTKQIERTSIQLGDLEGENGNLRRTVGTQEDEIKRLRLVIQDHKQNLTDARGNLEDECRQRIEIEMDKSLAVEERDFMIAIIEKENDELKKILNTDVVQVNIKNLWEGEITACIKQLQDDNDIELGKIKAEYQSRYDSQLQAMSASQMKENANLVKMESEITRLKNKNVDQGPLIAELNSKLHALQLVNDRLSEDFAAALEEWERIKSGLLSDNSNLQQQLADLLDRFRDLQDDKMTLETEISTYRRLLQGEEDSMERFVSDSSGARSKGADTLSDVIQSSSSLGYFNQSSSSSISGIGFGGSGSGGGSGHVGIGDGFYEESGQTQQSSNTSGVGGGSQLTNTEGKVFIKKKATGPLCIDEAQGSGAFVSLAYGTKEKKPAGPINLNGWKVCRQMEGDTDFCAVYEFTSEYIMQPAGKLKIFGAKYSRDANKKNGDLVAEFQTWRSGGGKFILRDPSQNEKGFLTIEFR